MYLLSAGVVKLYVINLNLPIWRMIYNLCFPILGF